MKCLWVLVAAAVAATGCNRKTQFSVSASFGLGTNATVKIDRELPRSGYYVFILTFPGVDRSQFRAETWPLEMESNLRLLVKTNGQTALKTNVSKLAFDNISDKRKRVAYGIAGFSVSEPVKMECVIEDLDKGPQRPVQVVLFRAMAK